MKYRIVTKNGKYRVQRYSWWMWRDIWIITYDKDGEFREVIEYQTLQQAKDYINRIVVDKWEVVEE